jgi:transcriptional regulator
MCGTGSSHKAGGNAVASRSSLHTGRPGTIPLDNLKEAPYFFFRSSGEEVTGRNTNEARMAESSSLLQGTLELLVLKTLSLEPMHGWGIAQRIEQMSSEVFRVNQGSLYPALQRMKRKGWIRSEWRATENNRRARYYMLTAAGERQLGFERADWERSAGAVFRILDWSRGVA